MHQTSAEGSHHINVMDGNSNSHAAIYVCLRLDEWPVLHTARVVTLVAASSMLRYLSFNPAITVEHTLQRISIYTLNPGSNIPISATHPHTNSTTPPPAPPKPTWLPSCALACPPQNPATLSLKHRTPQQAAPNNMASTRKRSTPASYMYCLTTSS